MMFEKPPPLAVRQRLRPKLGTWVSVRCVGPDMTAVGDAVEAAFAVFDRIGQRLHPTRTGSDLDAIRSRSGVIEVDAWTWELLRASMVLRGLSKGVFDPRVPGGEIGDVRLYAPRCVEIVRPVSIDLGGIAKGFAVDRAIDAIRERGCSSAVVNAGGDLRVFGADDFAAWVRTPDVQWSVPLRDAACAVSCPHAEQRPSEHRGFYRLDSAADDDDRRARWAAVVAPSAMWADALATYAMVCRTAAERLLFRAVLAQLGARTLDAPVEIAAQKKPGCWAGLGR